ncbi:MAG: type II toxin-antitoxin system VapC family toxin [Planctomycetes bacterium]|nr:type II toxin-antitoxin system VapC family toxin [Planctomycetota bacterium]
MARVVVRTVRGMKYLFDTNVLQELLRPRGNRGVIRRLSSAPAEDCATSIIVVAELRAGTRLRPDPGQAWNRVENAILQNVTVLDITSQEALVAGDVMADLLARGLKPPAADLLIAATALSNDLILVSRNLKDFSRIAALKVENWFE